MKTKIETAKKTALHFYDDIIQALNSINKAVNTLRTKVIIFRDFCEDEDLAIQESEFFYNRAGVLDFINPIIATGGGRWPENGLEAIALAIKSDWREYQQNSRQIILLLTDAPPLRLGVNDVRLPTRIEHITNDEEFLNAYNNFLEEYPNTTRLIIFGPSFHGAYNSEKCGNDNSDDWENWVGIEKGRLNLAIYYPTKFNEGLDEFTYAEISNLIASSV